MELVFASNVNLSKFNVLVNSFYPPLRLPIPSRKNKAVIRRFQQTVKKDYFGVKKDYFEMLSILAINDDVAARLKGIGHPEFIDILNDLEMPTVVDLSFDDYANELTALWGKKEKVIAGYLKRVFGFGLPKMAYIMLSENYFYNGGNLYVDSPVIISLVKNISKRKRKIKEVPPLALLLHELLHALVRQSKVMKAEGCTEFEEALLDYFAPIGMLTERIGMANKTSIADHQKRNAMARQKFNSMSQRLLPAIEAYSRHPDGKTIWEFLKGTEFKEYLSYGIKK